MATSHSDSATRHACARCGHTGEYSGTGPHECPGCSEHLQRCAQPGTSAAVAEQDARPAARFQTNRERASLVGNAHDGPSALVINPRASVTTLLAAVEARVCLIETHLGAWASDASEHEASPEEVVAPSLDLAEQITLLVAEITARRRLEGGAA